MIIKPRSRAARREQREKLGWCSKQTKMFKTFQILAASVNRIKHTTRILVLHTIDTMHGKDSYDFMFDRLPSV